VPSVDLTDHFLIAMPSMADPNFSRAVAYVCEHNDRGALGLVINRPTDMTLGSLYERVSLPLAVTSLADTPVYYGGPVQQDRGFVLHRPAGAWKSSLAVRGRVALTTSRDILEAIGAGSGPDQILVSLGYAGWAAGQLEHELGQNAWLTVPAREDIIFETEPGLRLAAAMQLIGVDYARLQDVAGHA
jgi:putative transcriptional regulator